MPTVPLTRQVDHLVMWAHDDLASVLLEHLQFLEVRAAAVAGLRPSMRLWVCVHAGVLHV